MYCHELCLLSQLPSFFFFLPKVLCRCFKWLVSYYTHNGESDFRNTILGGVASRYFCPLLWPAKITIFCRVSLLSFEPLPWIKALSLRFLERKIIASQHEVKDIFYLGMWIICFKLLASVLKQPAWWKSENVWQQNLSTCSGQCVKRSTFWTIVF